jgi:heme-degrading monooxygenase HmoA
MVLEVAIPNVIPGREAEFEAAFRTATRILSSIGGYLSHQLQRCVENQSQYILLVHWETEAGMLSKAEIMCFTATKNPEAAKNFYEGVLGLPLLEESPFALVFDANGTMLRIQKVQEHSPARHTSLGWKVGDIRAQVDALFRKGVSCERYERLSQDEAGIWESPSGALVAWFLDPDGNTLSLTEWPAQKAGATDRAEMRAG